jgi:hypothetical protein
VELLFRSSHRVVYLVLCLAASSSLAFACSRPVMAQREGAAIALYECTYHSAHIQALVDDQPDLSKRPFLEVGAVSFGSLGGLSTLASVSLPPQLKQRECIVALVYTVTFIA